MLQKLKQIGPGAMVAAAFIGPGTVTTATLAGAGYGYTLLWAILFSILATAILQEMTVRLGVVGKLGVGEAIRTKLSSSPFIKIIASILVLGAILVGNAAYEAGNLTGAIMGFNVPNQSIPVPLLIVGVVAFGLLLSGQFAVIEKSLVALVALMGLVFLISAFMVQPDVSQILKNLFIPAVPSKSLIMVVGLIGTTVVPYNLFLHASSAKKKWGHKDDLKAARWDTYLSVGFGGIITMAILITAAAAFNNNPNKISDIQHLSVQLQPLLGNWSDHFLTVGFLAAGLSSAITAPLAAAFATSEILNWSSSLTSARFRFIWIIVLVTGMVFSSLGFKPTALILFAQVTNGLLLPIIAAFLLWIMNDQRIMTTCRNTKTTNILGLFVILITILLGMKGVLSATGLL